MWRNYKGFSLVESMVGISLLFMLMTVFIPLLIHFHQNIENTRLKAIALQEIKETLENRLVNGIERDQIVIREGTTMKISWIPSLVGVCAHYKSSEGKENNVCVKEENSIN